MPATAQLAAVVALAAITQLQAFVPTSSSRTTVAKTSLRNLYLGEEGSDVAPPRVGIKTAPETLTTPQPLDSWQLTSTNMEDAMEKNLSKLIADIESEGAKASSIKVEYAKHDASSPAEKDKDSNPSGLNRMQFQAISEDLDAVLNEIQSDVDAIDDEVLVSKPQNDTDMEASVSPFESDEELVVAEANESQDDTETITSSFTFESNEEVLDDEESQGAADTGMTSSPETDSVESDDEELLVLEARTDSPEYDDNDGDSGDDDDGEDDVPLTSTADEESREAPQVMAAATGRPTIVIERSSQKSSMPKKKHPLTSVLGEPNDGQTKEADEWMTRFFKDGSEFDASAKQEPTRTKEAATPEVEPKTTVSPWDTLLETDFTSRLIDTFTPEENIRMLKEQQDVDIVKVAVSHFSKALVGGGKAAFSTIGAMWKAAKSPEVVECAKEASSTVSAATKSISDALNADKNKAANDPQFIADITKEVGVAASSVGNVASAFLKSLGCTEESKEALDAASETTKECASLLASLSALGIKQGERINEYVVSMENNSDGTAALSKKSLDDIVASVKVFGSRKGERLKDSLASLEDMVSASTGVSKEGKSQDSIKDKASVSPTKMSFDDFRASVTGFGLKQRERAQAQIDVLKSKMKSVSTKKVNRDASTNDKGFRASTSNESSSSTNEKSPTNDVLATTTKEYGIKIDALKEKMNSFTSTIPDGSDGAASLPLDNASKGPTSVDDIVNLTRKRISSVTDTFQSNINAIMSTAKAQQSSTSLPQPPGAKPIEDVMKTAKSIGDVGSVFLQSFGKKLESDDSSSESPQEYISRSTFSIARPQASFTALGAKVATASFGKKGNPGDYDYDDDQETSFMEWPQGGLSSMAAFGIQQGERAQEHLAKTTSRLFMRRNRNEKEQASPRMQTKLNAQTQDKREDSESSLRLGADEAWNAAALELEEELNLGELLAGIEIDGEPLVISSLYTPAKRGTNADENFETSPEMKEATLSDANTRKEPKESPFFFATM